MRKYISSHSKVNEIKMLLNKKNYKSKTFVLLEGGTDLKLFRNIFEGAKVQIESLDGKENIESAILDLSKEHIDRIIALCDADFDHLNNQEIKSEILFLTDTHDSETMMIESSATGALISEYATSSYYEGLQRNLLKKSIEACYEIGLTRWINHDEKLEIKFKGISFDSFISINKLNVVFCCNSFVQELINNSPYCRISKDALLEKINLYKEKEAAQFQVCCGHDLTKVMSMILSEDGVGGYKLNPGRVESSLRLAYSFSDFQKTALYSKLRKWEQTFSKEVFAA